MNNLSKTTKRYLLYIMVLQFCAAPLCIAGENLAYTNLSVDFYGYMQGLKVGDEITAYDPDGVLCGTTIVTKDGAYGFLHVYGDDITSPADEGAEVGDEITFMLNGINVSAAGPDQNIWTSDGAQINVDLKY